MDNDTLRIVKTCVEAKLPTRGSAESAGYDLYSAQNVTIQPHKTTLVGTGLRMQLPVGTFASIYARSGLATRHGIRPANCVGVCDSDYRGEYKVALYNDSDTPYIIEIGDRIAQMVIMHYLANNIIEVENLDDSDRGTNGFGSTGK